MASLPQPSLSLFKQPIQIVNFIRSFGNGKSCHPFNVHNDDAAPCRLAELRRRNVALGVSLRHLDPGPCPHPPTEDDSLVAIADDEPVAALATPLLPRLGG